VIAASSQFRSRSKIPINDELMNGGVREERRGEEKEKRNGRKGKEIEYKETKVKTRHLWYDHSEI